MVDMALCSFCDNIFLLLTNHSSQTLLPCSLINRKFLGESMSCKKISSKMTSCLLGQPLKLELWMTIMKIIGQDRTNGDTDRNTQSNSKWTHTWNNVPMFKKSSSLHLPQGSGQDIIAEGILSEFHPLQRHLQPSPRPSNWLENKALYTKQKRHTKLHWNGYLRDSSKKTHHQHHNWHYQL